MINCDHLSPLGDYLYQLYKSQSLCDLSIITKTGTTVLAHKLVVAAFSGAVRTEVEKWKDLTQMSIVVDCEVAVLMEFLDYMYTGNLHLCEELFPLLQNVSHGLQIPSLQKYLEEYQPILTRPSNGDGAQEGEVTGKQKEDEGPISEKSDQTGIAESNGVREITVITKKEKGTISDMSEQTGIDESNEGRDITGFTKGDKLNFSDMSDQTSIEESNEVREITVITREEKGTSSDISEHTSMDRSNEVREITVITKKEKGTISDISEHISIDRSNEVREMTVITKKEKGTISDISKHTSIDESNEVREITVITREEKGIISDFSEQTSIDQSNEVREITMRKHCVNGDCISVSGKVKNGRNLEMNKSIDSQSFEMCHNLEVEDDETSADVDESVGLWEDEIEVIPDSSSTSNKLKQGKLDSLIKESYVLLERIDSLVENRDFDKTLRKTDQNNTHDTSGQALKASSILVTDGRNKYTFDAEHLTEVKRNRQKRYTLDPENLTNRKKKSIRYDRRRLLMNYSQSTFGKMKPTMKKFKKNNLAELLVGKLKKLYTKQNKDILVQKIGYSCKICKVWDKNISRIKLHINLKHRNIQPRKRKSTSKKRRKCKSKKRNKLNLEERKNKMEKIEQKIQNFECFRCDKSYLGIRGLATHLIEKHKLKSDRVQKLTGYPKYFKYKKFSNQKCEECNIDFDSLSDFRAHCRSVHKKKRLDPDIACTYENCSEKFLLESELIKHIVEFHDVHEIKSVERMTLKRGDLSRQNQKPDQLMDTSAFSVEDVLKKNKERTANECEKFSKASESQISSCQKKNFNNVSLPSEKDRCKECPKSSICRHKLIDKEVKHQKMPTGYSRKVHVIKQTMTCMDCERSFTNLRNLSNHLQSIHKYTFEQAREVTGYPSFVRIIGQTKKLSKCKKFHRHRGNFKELQMTKDTSDKESNANEKFPKATESQISSYQQKKINNVLLPSEKDRCIECPKSSICRHKLIEKEVKHQKMSTGYPRKVDVIKQTMTCMDCERNFTNLRNLSNHLQSIHRYTFEQAREATGYPSFVRIMTKDTSDKESAANARENFTKAIESQSSSYQKKKIKYKVLLPSKKYTCDRCPKSSVCRNKLIHKHHREIRHKKILVSKLFISQQVLKKHICQSFSCVKHLSNKPFQQGSVISMLDSNNRGSPGSLLNQSNGKQKRCKGNQFTCLKCRLSFQYYSCASLHFKKKHGKLQLRQQSISSRIKKHVNMRSSMFSRESCLHKVQVEFNEKNRTCDKCKKTFSSVRKLSRHLKDTKCHADYQLLKQTGSTHKVDVRKQTRTCVDCKRSFTTLRYLANHLQCIHKYTFEQAREATGYPSHIKIIGQTKKVPNCQKCSEVFPTMKDLKAHTVAVHGIPCKFCDAKFLRPVSLKRHGFRKHREHIKEFQMITYMTYTSDKERTPNEACEGENFSKASMDSESRSSSYQKKTIKYNVFLPSKKYTCNRCPKSSVCRNKLIHKIHREIRHKKILVSKLFTSQLILKKNMCQRHSFIKPEKSVPNDDLYLTSKSEKEDIEKISEPKVAVVKEMSADVARSTQEPKVVVVKEMSADVTGLTQEPKVVVVKEMSADVAGLTQEPKVVPVVVKEMSADVTGFTQEPKVVVVKEMSADVAGLTHYFKDKNNFIEPSSCSRSNMSDQLTLLENSALIIRQNSALDTINDDFSRSLNNSSIINEKQKKCKRNQFTCLKCGLSFPYYSMASLHLKKKHERHQLRQRFIFSRIKKHVRLRTVLFSRDPLLGTNTFNLISDEKRPTKCDICDQTFSCNDTLTHHLTYYHTKQARRTSSNLGKQRISCVHCNTSLKYPRTYAGHLQIVHHYTAEQAREVTGYPSFIKKVVYTKKPTKCQKCFVIFPTLKEYKAHEVLVHGIPCKFCGEKFSQSSTLKRHWIKEHPENVHDLDEMKAISLTRTADEEENRREAEKIFECDNCNFTTRKLNLLSSHIIETHPEVKHCCSACGYFYRSQYDVELHMDECKGKSKKYQEKCSVCNEMFYETSSIQIHQFKVHGIQHPNVKEYKCDFDGCNTTTYTLENFDNHKKMHTREKKFSCDECQYTSALYSHLLRHVRSVHRRLKPHLCEGCGKSFSSNESLMLHISRFHTRDTYKFQCEYCPFQSITKCNLQNHLWNQHKVRMVDDDRQYFQCDQCTYQTPHRTNFVNHTNSHNNVRNYICDQCDARFVSSAVLVAHQKYKHSTKDQDKICSQCGYRAKTTSSLNMHIRVQHQLKGIKPYKCDYCDFRSATGGNCRKHIMGKHKGLPVHYTCDKEYLEKAKNARKAGNTNQLFE